MVKPENYVMVQGWMRTELDLKGNDLFLYAMIYGFTQDGETEFSGSLRYMQEWLGVGSKHTVLDALERLHQKGYIKKRTSIENGIKRSYYVAAQRGSAEIALGTLFNKIKNIFKNMHYLWLQFFFRDLVEGGKLAALGYKMPDIPESGGQQDAPRENEPDSSNLPGEAEPLEEVDAEELDDAEEPAADELTKATEIARQNGGVTQAMLEQQMGVTAEKAIALLDDMESAGVIEFSNGHYTIAAADSEEE